MQDLHEQPQSRARGHTWQLAVQLVPRAKDQAENAGKVLLQLPGDLLLRAPGSQAHEQGAGLRPPSPSQCPWGPWDGESSGAATPHLHPANSLLRVLVHKKESPARSMSRQPRNGAWLFG